MSQSSLFFSRRFLPMFFTQFFGAFNDNLYKYALLAMFSYGWLHTSNLSESTLNNLAALLFILPFFFCSATAGQLADRYEPSRMIRYLKSLEIVAMCIASMGFMIGNIYILLFALFLMGTQSAFFGPIKYSILPNLLKQNELIAGNALFQSGTSLAILFGMVVGGLAIAFAQGNVWWIIILLLLFSIIGLIFSLFIPKQKISDQDLKVNWNLFKTSWQIMQLSYQYRLVFFILLANSWYWFYGATIITQMMPMTRYYLLGNESVSTLLLTFFSIGVVFGSALCKKVNHSGIKFQWIIYGAIGLTLCLAYLAWGLLNLIDPITTSTTSSTQQYFTIMQILVHDWRVYHVFLAIILLGVSGGLYIVPLYTLMQSHSPHSQRARMIAANNIFNAIFMVVSALFCIVVLKYSNIVVLFLITSMINILVCMFLLKKVKFYLDSTKS